MTFNHIDVEELDEADVCEDLVPLQICVTHKGFKHGLMIGVALTALCVLACFGIFGLWGFL